MKHFLYVKRTLDITAMDIKVIKCLHIDKNEINFQSR